VNSLHVDLKPEEIRPSQSAVAPPAVSAGSTNPPKTIDRRRVRSSLALRVKRFIDIVVSAGVCIGTLPASLLIAAAIKCVSRGPVFYGQVRVGQDGRSFRMWKFRTMVEDAERQMDDLLMDHPEQLDAWTREFKLSNDPRIIPRIGKLLRRSSLDELPQFWNVLIGEMSLVGPRPLPQYHLDQFDDEFRFLRGTMPPGITGQWQVCSRRDGGKELFRHWDTEYVNNWSIWRDLWILLRTPWAVLSGR
jgi:lipopolysaccharide/colanic/teichoic acid biosynthesis glycosyltransferase